MQLSFIIVSIFTNSVNKENNFLVTKDNLDEYLISLKTPIKNYDLNKTLSK